MIQITRRAMLVNAKRIKKIEVHMKSYLETE